MNCPKCKTEISVEHNYCHKCGEDLIGQCRCGEKDYNKAVNLCGRKLAQVIEEEGKVNEKIRKLQDIFAVSFPTVLLSGVFAPLISLVVFNKTLNTLIPMGVAVVLLLIVYVIIRRRKEKIIKNFSDRYPEYYTAK